MCKIENLIQQYESVIKNNDSKIENLNFNEEWKRLKGINIVLTNVINDLSNFKSYKEAKSNLITKLDILTPQFKRLQYIGMNLIMGNNISENDKTFYNVMIKQIKELVRDEWKWWEDMPNELK